jgi:putative phosphoribosyl transferase
MEIYFRNRMEAAQKLAVRLKEHINDETVIMAIPKGAVPMAYSIAESLGLPFELMLVRKIFHPYNAKLPIGALTSDSQFIFDDADVPAQYIERETERLRRLIRQKYDNYYQMPHTDLNGKTVVVVDDGIDTGQTMLAAVRLLRYRNPAQIIAAVPVGCASAVAKVKEIADKVICLYALEDFHALGHYYDTFEYVSDEVVKKYLEKAAGEHKLSGR